MSGDEGRTEFMVMTWKSQPCPHPKEARKVRPSFKMMSIVFFDNEEIFHRFNPLDQTVYQQLLSPMALEERCQKTTSRYVAHSELAPGS
jgi:hypothetical protein